MADAMRSLGSSSSLSSQDGRVDNVSQAVLSFMYEAGLLIVTSSPDDKKVVAIVRDSPLAQCHEVLAYDEPEENQDAVEALDALRDNGLASCAQDKLGRMVYKLSFKGEARARSLRFKTKP